MIYDVLAQPVKGIDFAPASKAAEILQNLRTIITTAKYSVPLDRDFGFNAEMLDKPVNAAQAQLQSEIIMAIKLYEPRVTVTGISFTGTDDGQLIPKVQVMINDDE
ncbi:GPW/gp25 family protein [Phascolarctobacterium succinatutens]|uniref:GPW/gp25 family protein n=1 Tax=Phascolarctobacterium succinatutens TaxID=626940 RepID=UPI0040281766